MTRRGDAAAAAWIVRGRLRAGADASHLVVWRVRPPLWRRLLGGAGAGAYAATVAGAELQIWRGDRLQLARPLASVGPLADRIEGGG